MIVVLTEEPSSAEMLKRVIPKILPDMLPQLDLQIVEHRGIGDLKAKLPSLLRGWPGDARFIVVCDRDRRDCVEVKREILEIANPYNRPVLVRIACEELESWYFGDLNAVSEAYGVNLDQVAKKRGYRDPDKIVDPKSKLRKLVPDLMQVEGGRLIGDSMVPERNTSHSFTVFADGLRRVWRDMSA